MSSSNTNRKLTILVVSIQAVGHVNSCAGALTGLLRRGHRIIFLVNRMFAGKLTALGYEEHVFASARDAVKATEKVNPGEVLAKVFQGNQIIGPYSPKEKMANMFRLFDSPALLQDQITFDGAAKEAIQLYKPDAFYVDGGLLPALYYSGLPWISNISPQPIFFRMDEDLPPGGGGFPTDGDRTEWPSWTDLQKKAFTSKNFNDLIENLGYARFPNDTSPKTQLLTVYAYPEELNYSQIRSDPSWFNLEVFNKPKPSPSLSQLSDLVPETFLSDTLNGSFSGKLIYLSMGSMGSIDLDLMNRLVGTLSKTAHKYIVSQGPRAEQYRLGENMWGAPFLPQTSILPYVDLVITHGGNNSVTEAFSLGKVMIVLPLFGDQYDNAQRLEESKYGRRIDPYAFTDEQLLGAIEEMLADQELREKLNQASGRIQSADQGEKLAIKIESLLGKP